MNLTEAAQKSNDNINILLAKINLEEVPELLNPFAKIELKKELKTPKTNKDIQYKDLIEYPKLDLENHFSEKHEPRQDKKHKPR